MPIQIHGTGSIVWSRDRHSMVGISSVFPSSSGCLLVCLVASLFICLSVVVCLDPSRPTWRSCRQRIPQWQPGLHSNTWSSFVSVGVNERKGEKERRKESMGWGRSAQTKIQESFSVQPARLTLRASCWNLAAFLVSATARSTKPTDWSMLLSILSIIPPLHGWDKERGGWDEKVGWKERWKEKDIGY